MKDFLRVERGVGRSHDRNFNVFLFTCPLKKKKEEKEKKGLYDGVGVSSSSFALGCP